MVESARTYAFKPHFVGFLGMYCLKISLPLNPIMVSSIQISSESVTLLEMGNERLKERAKLEEWIMTRFSPLVVPVVIEIKEPED